MKNESPSPTDSPKPVPRQMSLATRAGLMLFLVAMLPGLFGVTGSSWHSAAALNPALTPMRGADPAFLGAARGIRSDEWSVNTPIFIAQMMATPKGPLLNPDMVFGQIMRSAATESFVLDWGLLFKPTMLLAVFLPWPYAHGIMWSVRNAIILVLAYFCILGLARRLSFPTAQPRTLVVASMLGAVAIHFSSAFQWWLSSNMPLSMLFLAGGVFAMLNALDHIERNGLDRPARCWTVAATYLFACGFFIFYPSTWPAALLLVVAPIADRVIQGSLTVTRLKLIQTAVAASAAGLGLLLALIYYAPYVSLVLDTVYPGKRTFSGGVAPLSDVTLLHWPSLPTFTPLMGGAHSPLAVPNACEASRLESPFIPIALLLCLTPRGRRYVRLAFTRAPISMSTLLLVLGWCFFTFPQWLAAITGLRGAPPYRAFFVVTVVFAILAAAVLVAIANGTAATRTETQRPFARWLGIVVGAALIGGSVWLALPSLEHEGFARANFWRHTTPIVLIALGLVAFATTRGAAKGALFCLATWAGAHVVANVSVNPMTFASELFLQPLAPPAKTPGRVASFAPAFGATLLTLRMPTLNAVLVHPTPSVFRSLAKETPNLTEDVFNRYAHVQWVLPDAASSSPQPDLARVSINPCGNFIKRWEVNHLIVPNEHLGQLPCVGEFRQYPYAGHTWLERINPLCALGLTTPTGVTYQCQATHDRFSVVPERAGLSIRFHPSLTATEWHYAMASELIGRVRCGDGARVLQNGDDLVFYVDPNGEPVTCQIQALDSVTATAKLVLR